MAILEGSGSGGTNGVDVFHIPESSWKSSVAALDRPEFNTVDFINQIFPNEASLVSVDPLIQRLRNRIRRVDAEILQAVRHQSSSGSKAREDLAAAMEAIKEICRDIKKLDFAKKHITTTITALNRLAMLVLAVERLQSLAAARQYRDAAGQLEAVTQLCSHFESYSDISKISELRNKFQGIQQTLKSHIFSDFSSLGQAGGRENESGQLMQQLAEACLVVDALDTSVRDELIRTVCSRELAAYQQIFQGTEVARLDKAERRYSWIKRQLKVNEDMWKIFPPSWRVPYRLCMQFCKITRSQLVEVLDSGNDKPDVATLLQALQSTLEFEEDLTDSFGGDASEHLSEGDGPPTPTADATHPSPQGGSGGSFRGSISGAFEPYLSLYVDLELNTLTDTLTKLVQEETWEPEEGSDTNILASSTQMFLHIRRSFNRCSQLTRSQTLFNLYKVVLPFNPPPLLSPPLPSAPLCSPLPLEALLAPPTPCGFGLTFSWMDGKQVFQRVLRAYADKLSGRLPRGPQGQGLVLTSGVSSDWQLKMSEKDERLICFIVNTAEYCHETAAQLAESIQNRIEAQFADAIDMSDEQDEYSGVITRALSLLVLGVETRLDTELAAMTRVAWALLESVGDQSEYVNAISGVLSSSIPVIASLLSPVYFQFFLEKLAASFAPRFYVSIFKCKRISGTGAQQMLLDTHAVKTLLLDVTSMGGPQVAAATYSKYVTRELGKAEALLKVILSPSEAIADTYRALLPDGSAADFQRILDLKASFSFSLFCSWRTQEGGTVAFG
eukprot:jgi/Mesen1/4462/ME000227S03482